MAQDPTITPASLTALRDSVSFEVHGESTFTDLPAALQTNLTEDGNYAFERVTRMVRWFTNIDPTQEDQPDTFNELFQAHWVALAIKRLRSAADYHIYMREVVGPAEDRAVEHYSPDWGSSSFLGGDAITLEQFRKSVAGVMIRQRTRVFVPHEDIDRTIREEFVKLWNHRQWEFTKRLLQLQITANGDVTADPQYTFDGLASQDFWILPTATSTRPCKVEWVDASKAAELAGRYRNTTGLPRYFYDLDYGTEKKVALFPHPDQAYTAYATVKINAPVFGGLADSDPIGAIPIDFRGHLRDSVIARLVSRYGRENADAARLERNVIREREFLATEWDNKGASRHRARPHGRLDMVHGLRSNYGGSVIGPAT